MLCIKCDYLFNQAQGTVDQDELNLAQLKGHCSETWLRDDDDGNGRLEPQSSFCCKQFVVDRVFTLSQVHSISWTGL